MKVVIKDYPPCDYATLSPMAVIRYAQLKGKSLYWYLYHSEKKLYFRISDITDKYKQDRAFWHSENYYALRDLGESCETFPKTVKAGAFNKRRISRTDPVLIQVIEELGPLAGENGTGFEVVEIPDGIEWKIIKSGYLSCVGLLDDSKSEIVVEKKHCWGLSGNQPFVDEEHPAKKTKKVVLFRDVYEPYKSSTGLSDLAIKKYIELKKFAVYPYIYNSEAKRYFFVSDLTALPERRLVNYSFVNFGESYDEKNIQNNYDDLFPFYDSYIFFYREQIPRDDPVLIQIIEELGFENAFENAHRVGVVEIPDGIEWQIVNYLNGGAHNIIVERGHVWGELSRDRNLKGGPEPIGRIREAVRDCLENDIDNINFLFMRVPPTKRKNDLTPEQLKINSTLTDWFIEVFGEFDDERVKKKRAELIEYREKALKDE